MQKLISYKIIVDIMGLAVKCGIEKISQQLQTKSNIQ